MRYIFVYYYLLLFLGVSFKIRDGRFFLSCSGLLQLVFTVQLGVFSRMSIFRLVSHYVILSLDCLYLYKLIYLRIFFLLSLKLFLLVTIQFHLPIYTPITITTILYMNYQRIITNFPSCYSKPGWSDQI